MKLVGTQAQRDPEGGGVRSYLLDLDRLVYSFVGNSNNGKAYVAVALDGADKPFYIFGTDRDRVEKYLDSLAVDISEEGRTVHAY